MSIERGAAKAAKAGPRLVRAPRGPERTCKGWAQEAALWMLMNNLDPEVAERPQDLVVYGRTGPAALPSKLWIRQRLRPPPGHR